MADCRTTGSPNSWLRYFCAVPMNSPSVANSASTSARLCTDSTVTLVVMPITTVLSLSHMTRGSPLLSRVSGGMSTECSVDCVSAMMAANTKSKTASISDKDDAVSLAVPK